MVVREENGGESEIVGCSSVLTDIPSWHFLKLPHTSPIASLSAYKNQLLLPRSGVRAVRQPNVPSVAYPLWLGNLTEPAYIFVLVCGRTTPKPARGLPQTFGPCRYNDVDGFERGMF